MSFTRDEVDSFFAVSGKTLPGAPVWSADHRAGEQRAVLEVVQDGEVSGLQLTMTIYQADPAYLVLQINAPPPVCRLCLTGSHVNRATGDFIVGAHFHSWAANRPTGQKLPENLRNAERLMSGVENRDEAFFWFLAQTGIDRPTWSAPPWPTKPRIV